MLSCPRTTLDPTLPLTIELSLTYRCRFQGFRPGTIPPHLTPTYIAFAMDECAREATLEAMAQNNIRPFEDSRVDFAFESISIPPPKRKGKKKKKKSKKKQGKGAEDAAPAAASETPPQPPVEDVPAWLTFETMKEGELVVKSSGGWLVHDSATVCNIVHLFVFTPHVTYLFQPSTLVGNPDKAFRLWRRMSRASSLKTRPMLQGPHLLAIPTVLVVPWTGMQLMWHQRR